jgi:hypothetical protein
MWSRNLPGERAELRREIDAFVDAHSDDGLARLARIYGVLSLMEAPADWPTAERRLEALPTPPLGSTQDLWVVAVAKLLRYHHQPQAAFELLRPLVGSIVGARARALLQEELTFDALESREPYEAIAYMDAWLRGAAEEDRQASEAKVAIALGAVPEAALRASLRAMRTGRASGEGAQSHGYGDAIERLIGERLGQIAVDRGDAELARWLLDPAAGEPALGDEVSGQLGQLATSRRGIGSFAGRTVGLVLPTSSANLRDEVADVLRGVLWALEIGSGGPTRPGETAPPDRIRLVTRDDGGDAHGLSAAMEEVAGEGAAVIITALDPDTATEAATWASKNSLNVITLAAPMTPPVANGGPGVPSVFSVGEDWSAELSVLATALGSRGGADATVATLGDAEAMTSVVRASEAQGSLWQKPLSCDVLPSRAGESRFPLGAWAAAGVRRWLVAGSSECADDLVRGLRRGGRGGVVGLSLEAADLVERPPPGLRIVVAAAGIVPMTLASPADARVADARAMVAHTGAREGWWAAVAHDAAVLAKKALADLPPDTVSSAPEIAERRAFVRKQLALARAPLWTSERDGFGDDRVLARTIRAADLGAAQ